MSIGSLVPDSQSLPFFAFVLILTKENPNETVVNWVKNVSPHVTLMTCYMPKHWYAAKMCHYQNGDIIVLITIPVTSIHHNGSLFQYEKIN